MANTTLNLCTFNCKNVKTSVPEIIDLCNSHEFVFLQETWMSRAQLPTLSNINNEFVGYGLSSMKDEEQIYTGRPLGGIAVLWRKTLNKIVLLLPMIVIEFWDFNLHVVLSLHFFYVYIYHTIAQIIMMITCFIFLNYFRLLMNFSHPIIILLYIFIHSQHGMSTISNAIQRIYIL